MRGFYIEGFFYRTGMFISGSSVVSSPLSQPYPEEGEIAWLASQPISLVTAPRVPTALSYNTLSGGRGGLCPRDKGTQWGGGHKQERSGDVTWGSLGGFLGSERVRGGAGG